MEDKIRNKLNEQMCDWQYLTGDYRNLVILLAHDYCQDLSVLVPFFVEHDGWGVEGETPEECEDRIATEIDGVLENCVPHDEWIAYYWKKWIQAGIRNKIRILLRDIEDANYPKSSADAIKILNSLDPQANKPVVPGTKAAAGPNPDFELVKDDNAA